MENTQYIAWFDSVRMSDISSVGGKNASLGEMISQLTQHGVRVPSGFATTTAAYRDFLAQPGLNQADIGQCSLAEDIQRELSKLMVTDITALAASGKRIRQLILQTPLPPRLEQEIRAAHEKIQAAAEATLSRESSASPHSNISRDSIISHDSIISWAIRSSATDEDLPDASFAGQQETLLNIQGVEQVLAAIRQVFSSLYTDRAIAYRVHQKMAQNEVALSVGVQRMVRSDIGVSGVMFTLDTESGFDQVVLINAAYGLGETVVQGAVNPDEFYVYKPALQQGKSAVIRRNLGSKMIKMIFHADVTPNSVTPKTVRTVTVPESEQRRFSLSDAEVEELARYALIIERHYERAMDIEWGKDGLDGKLYVLQARPETVKTQTASGKLLRYRLKQQSPVLVSGRAIGQRIGNGRVCLVKDASNMAEVKAGDILVTDMTDPDWEPVMKRASAIVTNRGGRTCHAAIVARELGIPAVVGCGNATQILQGGTTVTVSCAEGDVGKVYQGTLEFEMQEITVATMPPLSVKISMNVANPEMAFEFCQLPNAGVGLARLEFIITRMIGIHPGAILAYPNLPADLKTQIEIKAAGYASPLDFYVEKLAEGVAVLGAAFAPKPVIVRFSDFKSNEYMSLLGGNLFEPHEENPMLGFRGAARYISPDFSASFALECRAIKRVREEIGLTHIEVMIPFVRTVEEARGVINEMAKNGLRRGENGLRIIMMCEVPSNCLLAEEFLQYFDGFSIGSNDLTQLTLGIDRDSAIVAGAFDERNAAVKMLISMAIQGCRRANKYIGICGQGPSDFPDLALWLQEQGIEAISLNPDTVLETWLHLAGKKS